MKYLLALLLCLPICAAAQDPRGNNISQLEYLISRADTGFERLVADSVTRPFNIAFRVSSTRPARVSYTISIALNIAVAATRSGTVSVATGADSTKWMNPSTVGNAWSALLGLGTHTQTYTITKFVPAGHWVQISTTSSGTGVTITYLKGQETTL